MPSSEYCWGRNGLWTAHGSAVDCLLERGQIERRPRHRPAFHMATLHCLQLLSNNAWRLLTHWGLPAGEASWDLWMLWSIREATNTSIILLLTSTMSSHSRNRLQPSLRAVLITYLAFISRSCALVPVVTTARLMHLGSTAESRST